MLNLRSIVDESRDFRTDEQRMRQEQHYSAAQKHQATILNHTSVLEDLKKDPKAIRLRKAHKVALNAHRDARETHFKMSFALSPEPSRNIQLYKDKSGLYAKRANEDHARFISQEASDQANILSKRAFALSSKLGRN